MPPSETTPLLPAGQTQSSPSFYFLRSYFNILLVFIPLVTLAHRLDWSADLRLVFGLLALVPLPGLVRGSTKQVSVLLHPIAAIIFDTSFVDLVEIIVNVVALIRDDVLLIRAFILGSVLANILFVLGCAFVAEDPKQNSRLQGRKRLVIPAAYSATLDDTSNTGGLLIIHRGTAIVLLGAYFAFLYFQNQDGREGVVEWGDRDWVSGRIRETNGGPDATVKNAIFGAISSEQLSVLGVVTYFCSKYLIISIQDFSTEYEASKTLIGLILLPLIVNLTKHIGSVRVAVEDEMELTIMYCVGSSIRIANFVAPLLIIGSWVSGHTFTFSFANFETVVLFVSVVLVNTLIQLIGLYFIILLAFGMSPGSA
ncbi:Vacuolar calcium ion transporter [Psilocybe cubensis]|uniref:Vacuolar calcium ion transporter n=2 Tax=Psilocybe cubensis TaxID=181762 RepID=A0ACB8HHD7_PSICU|nr:Vacuolar calcium ion transporter [Psilocybe cubensis]KAH9487356.1 Vacuolar calcium ion transporter [Psilocybe cubensis]